MRKDRRPRSRLAIIVFILGLILLVPFFVPDPAPPFNFLKNAQLRYLTVDMWSGSRVATFSYMLPGGANAVAEIASRELEGWTHATSSLDSHDFTKGGERVTVVGWNFGSEAKPLTHVLYDRPPGLVHHLRSPIHKIRSWMPNSLRQ